MDLIAVEYRHQNRGIEMPPARQFSTREGTGSPSAISFVGACGVAGITLGTNSWCREKLGPAIALSRDNFRVAGRSGAIRPER
jgi:hypothetical protein